MLRKKLAVLLAAAMMLAMASPALAVPGNGHGVGPVKEISVSLSVTYG